MQDSNYLALLEVRRLQALTQASLVMHTTNDRARLATVLEVQRRIDDLVKSVLVYLEENMSRTILT